MLRVVEHYVSVQGEGPRTGTLTQFVRFAGCNMRCPGWPCDTQHAIDPSIWRFKSEKVSAVELSNRVLGLAHTTGARNICLTGGEPFTQPYNLLHEFVYPLAHPSRAMKFEVFTNGSFPFPEWTRDPLIRMRFIMDWKLPGSWEQHTAIDERHKNALFLDENDVIKFVINDENDFEVAIHVARQLEGDGCEASFWVGKVWGAEAITDEWLVGRMKEAKLNWKLNVQVHKFIWPANKQGV